MYYDDIMTVHFNNCAPDDVIGWINANPRIRILDMDIRFYYHGGGIFINRSSWTVTEGYIRYTESDADGCYRAAYVWSGDGIFGSGKRRMRRCISAYTDQPAVTEVLPFTRSVHYQGGNGSQVHICLVVFKISDELQSSYAEPKFTPDESISALKWSLGCLLLPFLEPYAFYRSYKAYNSSHDKAAIAALIISGYFTLLMVWSVLSSLLPF